MNNSDYMQLLSSKHRADIPYRNDRRLVGFVLPEDAENGLDMLRSLVNYVEESKLAILEILDNVIIDWDGISLETDLLIESIKSEQ